jgi:hypothetical protein
MKKLLISSLTLLCCIIFSCTNIDKKHSHHSSEDPKNPIDSLLKEIDDLHVVGMSKMGQLTKLQQQVRTKIDSISKLSVKLTGPVSVYKKELDSLLKGLEYAEFAMDKWMPEYYNNTDTLADNISERIKYLNIEKIKATKIKEAILNGVQKADSLLKTKL